MAIRRCWPGTSCPRISATSATIPMWRCELLLSLANVTQSAIMDTPAPVESVLRHSAGVDFIPSNIGLSGVEWSLFNTMNREFVLRECLAPQKFRYDDILIDCMPSLGMMTIDARAVAEALRSGIGQKLWVFDTEIPFSVRAAGCSVEFKSIFAHDKSGKPPAENPGYSDFPNHPFQVRLDADMDELVQSVKNLKYNGGDVPPFTAAQLLLRPHDLVAFGGDLWQIPQKIGFRDQ